MNKNSGQFGSRIPKKFIWILVMFTVTSTFAGSPGQWRKKVIVFPGPHERMDQQFLQPNVPVTKKITGSGSHVYKLKLHAQQAGLISVQQRGVDLKLVIRTPDRQIVLETDSPNGSFGSEETIVVAEMTGDYELEIVPFQEDASSGNYTAAIKSIRNATADDRDRFIGYRALFNASEFSAKSDKDSYDAALKKYDEAYKTFQRVRDTRGQAVALYDLGNTEYLLSNFRPALSYMKRALPLWIALREVSGEANLQSSVGYVLTLLGEPKGAIVVFQRALLLQRQVGDRKGEADTLNNLAGLYKVQGRYQLAIQNLSKAIAIFEFYKNPAVFEVKASLGAVYADTGKYEKALNLIQEAIPNLATLENKEPFGSSKVTLADVNFVLGNRTKAATLYQEALEISRLSGNQGLESRVLNNIGRVELLAGDTKRSLELFESALKISDAIENKGLSAYITNNIGEVRLRNGEPASALEQYSRSVLAFRSVDDPQGEARTINYVGNAQLALGLTDEAIASFNQALAISRRVDEKTEAGTSLANLMVGWKQRRNTEMAVLFGKQAINTFQSTRSEIKTLDRELQKTYINEKESYYRLLAQLLIEQGKSVEAERVIAMLKEEEYAGLLSPARRSLPANLPYSGIEETALRAVDRVANFSREINELKAKNNPTSAEKDRIIQITLVEIPAANKALADALEALKKKDPKFENLIAAKQRENIQSILPSLGNNVIALYTVIGSSSLRSSATKNIGWILAIFPNGTSKAYPIDTANLDQAVFDLRSSLENPNCYLESTKCDLKKQSEAIYEKLFLQKSDQLKRTLSDDLDEYFKGNSENILMWSLDGVLRYIPLNVLFDGKRFLIERFTNVQFNTASLGSLKDAGVRDWKVLGLGVSEHSVVNLPSGKKDFDALPFGEEELRSLIQDRSTEGTGLFPGSLKLNKQFDKRALIEGLLDKPSLVHISSHFAFNPFNEGSSFLLIGNNGILEMRELEPYGTLFENVDLLSLSACNTATGTFANPISQTNNANGKEMEGFAYVAQLKGAKSVMASLWKVSDRGTKELMLRFYKLRKARPELSKAAAIREAQLDMLRVETDSNGPPYQNPYYWASFVLIGNWR